MLSFLALCWVRGRNVRATGTMVWWLCCKGLYILAPILAQTLSVGLALWQTTDCYFQLSSLSIIPLIMAVWWEGPTMSMIKINLVKNVADSRETWFLSANLMKFPDKSFERGKQLWSETFPFNKPECWEGKLHWLQGLANHSGHHCNDHHLLLCGWRSGCWCDQSGTLVESQRTTYGIPSTALYPSLPPLPCNVLRTRDPSLLFPFFLQHKVINRLHLATNRKPVHSIARPIGRQNEQVLQWRITRECKEDAFLRDKRHWWLNLKTPAPYLSSRNVVTTIPNPYMNWNSDVGFKLLGCSGFRQILVEFKHFFAWS